MRSAGNSPASLSQLLHGGEDVGRSEARETVSSLPTPPLNSSNRQATTMDNSSANQDGTQSKVPIRAQISIDPMHNVMSPMPGGNPTDIVNIKVLG